MFFASGVSLSVALLLSVAGTPALADLTADEAWNSLKAQIAALGLTVSAEEGRDGDALQVGKLALSADLPMQAGSVSIGLPGMRFEPLGDGTIGVSLPDKSQVTFGGEIAGEGSMNVVMDYTMSGYNWIMSGTPDRVVNTGSAASTRIELANLMLNGARVENASGSISVLDSRYQTTSVFTDGMITVDGATFYGSQDMVYDFEFVDGENVVGVSAKGFAEAMDMTQSITLPADGLNLKGLHRHLRDGVKMTFAGTTAKYSTEDRTTMDGKLLTLQKSDATDYEVSATLDERGIRFAGSAGAFTGSGQMAELPFPISLKGSSVSMEAVFPLLASVTPQDMAMAMELNELTVNEEIWGMFDPGAQLPRDPLTLRSDVSGQLMVTHDLLDFAALAGLDPGQNPIVPVSATLKDLLLRAVGAELTGNGAFTFDAEDTETFPGIPRPEGTLDLQMVGVNALIDRLVAAGMLPEDQAMSARMMLNMIAAPGDGEDTLESNIEINSEGHLIVNGQRLK